MPEPRSRLSPVSAGLAVSLSLSVLLAGAALLGDEGVVRHQKLRDELDTVRALNSSLVDENDALRTEAKALRTDPEYIESVIRDELGYVKKDELVFIFPAEPQPERGPLPGGHADGARGAEPGPDPSAGGQAGWPGGPGPRGAQKTRAKAP